MSTARWLPDGTAAWAECAVDLMDQPIVRFHYVSADGYGKDSYSWYDNLWLRVDRMSDTVQLVIEVDGEWSIEEQSEVDDEFWDVLADIRGGEIPDGFEERILPLLLRATAGRVSASPSTEQWSTASMRSRSCTSTRWLRSGSDGASGTLRGRPGSG